MAERFLFNRIDAEAAAAAIGGQNQLVIHVGSHKAEAAPATGNVTTSRTKRADQLARRLVNMPPVLGLVHDVRSRQGRAMP